MVRNLTYVWLPVPLNIFFYCFSLHLFTFWGNFSATSCCTSVTLQTSSTPPSFFPRKLRIFFFLAVTCFAPCFRSREDSDIFHCVRLLVYFCLNMWKKKNLFYCFSLNWVELLVDFAQFRFLLPCLTFLCGGTCGVVF